jgi:tetratricopeptide (TPR) repeat protein
MRSSAVRLLFTCVLSALGASVALAQTEEPDRRPWTEDGGQRPRGGWFAEYVRLIEQYRSGDADTAATTLALWPPSARQDLVPALLAALAKPSLLATKGSVPGDRKEFERAVCRAAAVLQLDAAARQFALGRREEGSTELDGGRRLLERLVPGLQLEPLPMAQRTARLGPPPERTARGSVPDGPDARFASAWLTTSGALLQSLGDHGRAYREYWTALVARPADLEARMGWATALEASVLSDGFGVLAVADLDLDRLLNPLPGLGWRTRTLSEDATREGHAVRKRLLEALAREYRAVLEAQPARSEARLRLGRVLVAHGDLAAGMAELQTVAAQRDDILAAALTHLCLARLATGLEASVLEYRKAVELNPSLRPAWLGLSYALNEAGQREQALSALEQAFAPVDAHLNTWLVYHLGRGGVLAAMLSLLRAEVRV